MEEIAFYQWTDKGYIFCRATIPIARCNQCDSTSWEEGAEQIIQQAVRREYDKLP
jgi:hypothetical protein